MHFGALAILALLAGDGDPVLRFERQKIGTVVYEAASAFDVDRDGAIDIVSGGSWFAGPDFTVEHPIWSVPRVGDYYDDFSDYPFDVNGDGWTDIITGGYFGQTLHWLENPKGEAVEWTNHDVAQVGPIERNCFWDLDGDGVVEVFPVTAPVHVFRLAPGEPTGFSQFTIQQPGGGGHGMGCGDVNGDGRADLLFASGWFEAPANPYEGEWIWRPEFDLNWCASVPILVHDVNADGRNDLIVGQAHDYGLAWWEQGVGPDGARTWTKHDVCLDRSQYHDLALADIDNDNEPELITGKRYYAHSGHDPGAEDPVGLYYFEINGGDFTRYTLDYGPASEASGAGIYLWVEDVDQNGWLDVVAPGKEGLYLFRNMGPIE